MEKNTQHKSRKWFLALPILAALWLFGCGGSNSASGDAYYTAETIAGQGMDMDGGYEMKSYAQTEAAAAPAMAAPVSGENTALDEEIFPEEENGSFQDVTDLSQTSLPAGRKLIRTVNLEVETTDFDKLLHSIQEKASQLEGYIEQSDITGNSITSYGRPSKKYASLVLRIPAERLNQLVSQVEADGNVTYKSENVSDVTLQYSDVESRLKTLRMEQERLWELMASADSTEAILALEQRLTDVSIEIETSESRLRHFDNSVTYSTVYLSISEVDLESPTQPETAGQQIKRRFTQNILRLGDALTDFCIGFLSSLPLILFWLLLAGS